MQFNSVSFGLCLNFTSFSMFQIGEYSLYGNWVLI